MTRWVIALTGVIAGIVGGAIVAGAMLWMHPQQIAANDRPERTASAETPLGESARQVAPPVERVQPDRAELQQPADADRQVAPLVVNRSHDLLTGDEDQRRDMTAQEYGRLIADEIRSRVRLAHSAGGTAVVRFSIDRSGTVVEARISDGSGNAAVDQAALKAVAIGTVFTRPPQSVNRDKISFSLPMRFQSDKPSPSFDCAKAVDLDEQAICTDARLSELDLLHARAYARAKRGGDVDALRQASDVLVERRRCFTDRVCIFDTLRWVEGAQGLRWIESYRKELVVEVLSDDLKRRSTASVDRAGTFPLSAKGVQATLKTISGLDSKSASASGSITQPDYAEYCRRDPGGETRRYGGSLSFAQCVEQTERRTARSLYSASADCSAKTVQFWDGTWRLTKVDAEYGTTTWVDRRGDEIEASNATAAVDGLFPLMCPMTWARLRAAAMRQDQTKVR